MSSSIGWRVRDAADDFLNVRLAANKAPKKGDDGAQAVAAIPPFMKLSRRFNVEQAQARLQRDKASLVQYAFDAAATFVLENIYADDETAAMEIPTKNHIQAKTRLLPELADTENLEEMRIFSMERAVDNKDLGKRKLVYAREQQLRQKQAPPPSTPAPAKEKIHPLPVASKDPTEKVPSSSSSAAAAALSKSNPSSSTPDIPTSNSSNKVSNGTATTTPSDPVKKEDSATGPKVSRNTSASSATALEARSRMSRAIICTTANVVFAALTPLIPGHTIDVANLPPSLLEAVNANTNGQKKDGNNDNKEKDEKSDTSTSGSTSNALSNMGAVVAEAQALGLRIQAVTKTSVERSSRRFQYRKDSAYFHQKNKENQLPNHIGPTGSNYFRPLKNPFAWSGRDKGNESNHFMDLEMESPLKKTTTDSSITHAWKEVCVPRLLSVLQTGAGHAIVHDVLWSTRHGRIFNFMQEFASKTDNFGPHLIITTQPDVDRWAIEFNAMDSHLRLLSTVEKESLRAMPYKGTVEQRRRLRKRFPEATGLSDASFHVIIASYTDFLIDYIHFCQTPFEIILMDDGCSWMAAAGEPNASATNATLTKVWEDAIFSKSDHNVGLAGSLQKEWDYEREDFDEDALRDAFIGLTARHRVMTSSKVALSPSEVLPFSRLVNFLTPQLADAVREEWDRSRTGHDKACREHFQKLLTRSMVVHDPEDPVQDMYALSLNALQGKIRDSILSNDPQVPASISDDQFVSQMKSSNARKYQLRWLGPAETSWLRYELGVARLDPILEAMLVSSYCGHVCEEIITVLAASNAGTTGHVTGSLAFKFAVRCGRSFGSEQGLRQHHSTMHALPGTWLCRICGADCVTSQARTHHERTCGQPKFKPTDEGPPPAAGKATKGKEQEGSSLVGTKKGFDKVALGKDLKDSDGSTRVLSYRGVWMDPAGKYFIKIEGKKFSDGSTAVTFDSVDEAARKYDAILKNRSPEGRFEYNFKPDGCRIVYEESSTSSTTGFGGNLDNVVPALSVINIRDLPKEVKPLLRDPRQTSRTGGNSKRHVYAYRGVCRQARKGHDRWQSQISFCGRNFYLGTYESEWDAAAIYAWAHLILYGKEATDQAQKEGEEAAAAYEKERHDIEAGILPAPAPKLSKKEKMEEIKRKNEEKKRAKEQEKKAKEEQRKKAKEEQKKKVNTVEIKKETKKRPAKQEKPKKPVAKKPKPSPDLGNLNQLLGKTAGKAPTLVPHPQFTKMSDDELMKEAATKLVGAQRLNYCISDLPLPAPLAYHLRPCISVSSHKETPAGIGLLLGLNPLFFDWKYDGLIKQLLTSQDEHNTAASLLSKEYGFNGTNSRFKSFLQGTTSVIGCASSRMQQMYERLGMGSADKTLGGPIGCIDCNIGGSVNSCSETAACIQYRPTRSGDFQLTALTSTDLVTLNGKRVTPELGSLPLFHEDICTVGARVFVFLLPSDTI
ncbi:hypothetical protein IV203_037184 [Nitzschia inconspicua]|uniref:AP2/ERF domain-containing protein n=1 Tax=Nitzschia inconspicua TaxID=303405 RepID=A0A9K3LKW9_9STRA|nr:hypothetical protein IV203_037184 [Nitzschia inconspicua]